jgi:hypothetical protein
MLAVVILSGCALGEDEVPETLVPEATCPTLDDSLPNTLALMRAGELTSLSLVVRELVTSQGGDRATVLIRAVLTVLGEIGLSNLSVIASGLEGSLLTDLEPFLASALRPFIEPEAGSPEAEDKLQVFELVAEAANTCPEGSLTGAVLVITSDVALVGALADTLRDPALHEFLEDYAGADATESDRAAIVTVLVTVIDAMLTEDFDVESLRNTIGLILPADRAPYTTLLDELARVLVGDNLTAVQTGVGCLRNLEFTHSRGHSRHGGRILAEAIYDVLSADGISAAGIADLIPADTAGLLGPINTALHTLRSQPQLRADLVSLLDFLARPPRSRQLLEGAIALLEVGGVSEIINTIAGLLGGGDCDLAKALVASSMWRTQ